MDPRVDVIGVYMLKEDGDAMGSMREGLMFCLWVFAGALWAHGRRAGRR